MDMRKCPGYGFWDVFSKEKCGKNEHMMVKAQVSKLNHEEKTSGADGRSVRQSLALR